MKKINLIYGLSLLVIITGILIVNSCKKQEVVEQINCDKQQTNDNKKAKLVYNKVINFLDKIMYIKENPGYKSGEQMSVDSALWNLNAGLNFAVCNPDEKYDNFYVDSAFVQLPVSGDIVNLEDVVNTYIEIESSTDDILNAAPYQEKAAKFTFIEIKSSDNSNVLLKSTTIVGEKGTEPEEPPFDEGNNWRYGNNLGMCNNPIIEYDAGDTIRDVINANRYLHVHDEGHVVLYSNPVTIENINGNHPIFDNPNDPGTPINPDPYDNERDYLMFYAHEDNCSPVQNLWDDFSCIEYDDMNFYYYGTTNVIYNKIPAMPDYWPQAYGKTFMHLDTLHGTNGWDNNNKEYYIHIIKVNGNLQ